MEPDKGGEGEKYFAPVGFDNILHKIYGDYMTMPPIEKQISHHKNSAYWRERVEWDHYIMSQIFLALKM